MDKGRGRLLHGEQKGVHVQGVQTHRRAASARCRAARAERALHNGAEVWGRMVKGDGGGACCCAESERATTRRAC